ncbi:MAG: aspartate--tRNA(Asn) ligase [Candidatus Dojkabacteria bacterium]|nr:aspartate--tRNA(Asn) ligase [Candidatus Dojkabacteria bacterium]MDD4561366.1 aspartate--tRNA(Asn) ligase [Candidatus Dojkabacteria bacterium]NLB12296.1 aspartate--tRNA(Asn) ligase [Candidatus Dojkabacteria bacterium]
MERVLISDLKEKIGNQVRIQGRVSTIRNQGKIVFLMIKDRTGIVQCVAWEGNNKELVKTLKSVTPESIVSIIGLVKEAKQVTLGYEVEIEEVIIDSLSETPLPIVIEEEYKNNLTALEQRLDYRWIDLRSNKNSLMVEVSSFFFEKLREFCIQNNFIQIHTPKILGVASEGGANVFEVKYFDRKAYLAQSPQFHKQMAIASDIERVFSIGPAFRAEKSYTTRHLTEYTSFDIEMAYIDSFRDVCDFEEEMLTFTLEKIEEKFGDQIKELFGIEVKKPQNKFEYLTVKEAKEKLAKANIPSKDDGDFSPEEERALSKIVEEESGSEFLFVTEFPHDKRAFYHMKDPHNQEYALGFDLLWKGVEITTGAQREHRTEHLIKNAEERGIKTETLQEYFDYFRYGCPPHGGFAIGTERFLMKLLGYSTVLETSFLPNTPNRLGRRFDVKD